MMHESVGQIWHLKNFYCPMSISETKQDKKFFSRYFLHLMRYLNYWDHKNFWGAKSGPLTHAWAVKCVCLSTFYVYWEFQFGIYIPFFNFLNQNFKKRCNFNIIFPIPYPIICIFGVGAPPSSIYILFIILLCIFDNFFLYYRKSVLCC